jgi:hypothetical protein
MGISYITVHGYEFIIDTDDWSDETGRSIAEGVLEERLCALTPEQAAQLHADLLDLADELPPLARDISRAAFEAGTAGWWRKPTSGHNTEIGVTPND